MYPFRDLAVAGGLMTYCIDLLDAFRFAGGQIAEILRGETPRRKFRFINRPCFSSSLRQTAQQIGLKIPASLLASADEVIE